MKGKIWGVTGLLALLLALSACGGQPDVSGSVAPPEEPEELEFEMGEMNGGVYTNEFLGLGCKLDSEWTYYNEEQIAELNNLTMDALSDEELKAALESAEVFQDMYAQADQGLVTMNVTFENLGVLYGMTLDEAQYIELSMENLESAMAGLGMADVTTEQGTVTLAGEERQAILLSATLSGVPFYEELVCIKRGNYMAVITMGSYMEDVTDELAGLFYALEA